jgi:hypothetical protein
MLAMSKQVRQKNVAFISTTIGGVPVALIRCHHDYEGGDNSNEAKKGGKITSEGVSVRH